MTRIGAFFVAGVLFFWMFLAADALEQLGAADRFRPAGRPRESAHSRMRHFGDMAWQGILLCTCPAFSPSPQLRGGGRTQSGRHAYGQRVRRRVLPLTVATSDCDGCRRSRHGIVRTTVYASTRRSRSIPLDVGCRSVGLHSRHLDDPRRHLPACAGAPGVPLLVARSTDDTRAHRHPNLDAR